MNRMGGKAGRMLDSGSSRKPDAGFTLVELLIVVSIISILAAIAVPNFLDAQVRAKVARVKADMRSMATALEMYRVDSNHYPRRHDTNVKYVDKKTSMPLALGPYMPPLATQLKDFSALTTPIAYFTTLYPDVFQKLVLPPNNLIDYYDPTQTKWLINSRHPLRPRFQVTEEEAGWLLVSVGPDNHFGLFDQTGGWPYNRYENAYKQTIYYPYDPTNGTLSSGNIYSGQIGGTDGTGKRLYDKFFPQEIYGK